MGPIPNGKMMAAALVLLAGAAGATGPPSGPLKKCPADSVVSGAGCMDKFEASVWRVPSSTTTNRALVLRIQQGKATAAELAAGGATPLGIGHNDDYAPCADSGQNCTDDIYAVSLPAVRPSANINWFQAQAACENSGKRLPSNAEWQAAVAGTPDPGGTTGRPTATPRARSLRSPPDRAAAASRRAVRSTWWATCTSGWRTGCRGRRHAARGDPASAQRATISAWRARRPPASPARCCAGAHTPAVRSPVRSRSSAPLHCRSPASPSASAALVETNGGEHSNFGWRPERRDP